MVLRVGVIGGGQLARMMIPAAIRMGIEIRVFAESPGSSAAIAATAIGDFRDASAVLDFAREVEVLTFDHEHVPQDVLAALVAAGVAVRPGPGALRFAQDKLEMRARLAALDIPQPDWAEVANVGELQAFIDAHGGAAVVKTPRGGYDGKGVRVVTSGSDADDWFAVGGALLAEERVGFVRELAQQVARRPGGELAVYPLVESVQRDGVCAEVIAPAPRGGRVAQAAARIAEAIAEHLDVTGMLAVELFETDDERILVNELAMRPHNSGHWSIDGAVTDQFEQHLRAVLDLPLGSTEIRAPWTVMVNILGGPVDGDLDRARRLALADQPTAALHLYGKDPRPGRKIGHVTACSADLDDAAFVARAAAAAFD
jgi:5-(carboxyamino)imidazole ribonucleotide synthase